MTNQIVNMMLQKIMNDPRTMQNEMMKNAVEMYQKGDTEGLNKLMNNVAQSKGANIDSMRKQLGI